MTRPSRLPSTWFPGGHAEAAALRVGTQVRAGEVPDYAARGDRAARGALSSLAEQVSATRQFFGLAPPCSAPLGDALTLVNHGVGEGELWPYWVDVHGFSRDVDIEEGDRVLPLAEADIISGGRVAVPAVAVVRWQDGGLGGRYDVDIGSGFTIGLPPARSVDVAVRFPGGQTFEVVDGRSPFPAMVGSAETRNFLVSGVIRPEPYVVDAPRRNRFSVCRIVSAGSSIVLPIPPRAREVFLTYGPIDYGFPGGTATFALEWYTGALPHLWSLVPSYELFPLAGQAVAVRAFGDALVSLAVQAVFVLEA